MTAAERNSKTRKNSQFNPIAVVGLGCSFDQYVEITDLWRLGPSVDALFDFTSGMSLQPIDKLAMAITNAVIDAEPLSSHVSHQPISIAVVDSAGTIDGSELQEHLKVLIPYQTAIEKYGTLTEALRSCAEKPASAKGSITVAAAVDKRALAVALVDESRETGATRQSDLDSAGLRPRIYAILSHASSSPSDFSLSKSVEQIVALAQIDISEVEMLQVSRLRKGATDTQRFAIDSLEGQGRIDPLQTIGLEGGDTASLECLCSTAFSLFHKVLVPVKKKRARGEQEIFPWVHGQIHKLIEEGIRDKLLHHLSRPRTACLIEEVGAIRNTVLLEEVEDANEVASECLLHKWDSELILLAASSHADLVKSCTQLMGLLASRPDLSLLSIASELAGRFKSDINAAARCALVVSSVEELKEKLQFVVDSILRGMSSPATDDTLRNLPEGVYISTQGEVGAGKTAFLLPGLGAAYPNMLSDLCVHFPEVRAAFDFVDHLAKISDREQNIQSNPDMYPSRRIFSNAASKTRKQVETAASLATMDSAVVAVLMSEWALFKLFQDLGVSPDVLVGCSTGEFAALSMCGTTNILDTASLFYRLSTAVARSVPQDQLSNLRSICVYADFDSLKERLTEFQSVYLSADFAPSQFILSGDTGAIEEVTALFTGLNKTVHRLPVAIPYHTPLVEGKIDLENNELVNLKLNSPQVETWCCSIAGALPEDTNFIKGITTELFTHPIRLKETVRKLYESGVRKFVEMGPRGNLTPFIAETLEGKPHMAMSANASRGSALTQILNVVAALACHGASVNPDLLYVRRRPRLLPANQVQHQQPQVEYFHQPEFEVELQEAPDADGEALVLANYMSSLASVHTQMVAVQQQAMNAYMSVFAGQQLSLDGPDSQLGMHYPQADFEKQTMNEPETAVLAQQVESYAQPFLRGAKLKRQDNSLSAEIFLSPSIHKFLLDHAIGGEVLTGSQSEKVYLVPLTVMLEIMAEAAAEFFEGLKVIAISNARAYKRIRVGSDGVSLVVRAKTQSGRTALVEIADEEVFAKCEVTFAENYSTPPAPQISDAKDGRPSKLQTLYSEGTMFHGPRMQAVTSIDSVGDNEITTGFKLVNADDWFSFTKHPQFQIDPLILDNGTQLTLYFLQEHDKSTNALLPFMLERLSLYAPAGSYSGQSTIARAYMRQASAVATEADIEILSPEGSLMYKFHGLSSRRICLPEQWAASVSNPSEAFLSQRLDGFEGLAKGQVKLSVSRLDGCLPDEEVARTWCLDYILNPQEMIAYNKLNGMRRREWLLGRVAAKDSVRRLLKAKYGLALSSADVIIDNLPSGQPIATGLWKTDFIDEVNLSLSHKGETAVALAASGTIGGAGIDIEEILEREDGFEDLAFNSDDVALLVQHSHSPFGKHKIATMMWSAKESVGKALGMNLGQQRLSLTVRSMQLEEGRPSVCTVTAKRNDRNDSTVSTHEVSCISCGDLIVAVTVGNQEQALSSERA